MFVYNGVLYFFSRFTRYSIKSNPLPSAVRSFVMSHLFVNSILPASNYNHLIISHEATKQTGLLELSRIDQVLFSPPLWMASSDSNFVPYEYGLLFLRFSDACLTIISLPRNSDCTASIPSLFTSCGICPVVK